MSILRYNKEDVGNPTEYGKIADDFIFPPKIRDSKLRRKTTTEVKIMRNCCEAQFPTVIN